MRHFIFVTTEGTTFQPGDFDIGNDVENLQVLGFERGIDENEAFQKLRMNSWLENSKFNEVFVYELKTNEILKYFYLNENEKKEPRTV